MPQSENRTRSREQTSRNLLHNGRQLQKRLRLRGDPEVVLADGLVEIPTKSDTISDLMSDAVSDLKSDIIPRSSRTAWCRALGPG
jgi:hypothetical protein